MERTSVYRAFDAEGRLLYVGIATNWARRWSQHAERSPFFLRVCRLDVEWLESRAAARERESDLIRTHTPPFNIRGATPPALGTGALAGEVLVGVCEACGREPAFSFSWFPDVTRWYAPYSGTWRITGMCTSGSERYYIRFARWIKERAWLKHLRGKGWFAEYDFVATVQRSQHPALMASLRQQHPGRW